LVLHRNGGKKKKLETVLIKNYLIINPDF